MNPQNQAKLRPAIATAGGAAIAKNGYVTAIDVLVGVGWLLPAARREPRRLSHAVVKGQRRDDAVASRWLASAGTKRVGSNWS